MTGDDEGPIGSAHAPKLILRFRRGADAAPHPHLAPGAGFANLCAAVSAGTGPGGPHLE